MVIGGGAEGKLGGGRESKEEFFKGFLENWGLVISCCPGKTWANWKNRTITSIKNGKYKMHLSIIWLFVIHHKINLNSLCHPSSIYGFFHSFILFYLFEEKQYTLFFMLVMGCKMGGIGREMGRK